VQELLQAVWKMLLQRQLLLLAQVLLRLFRLLLLLVPDRQLLVLLVPALGLLHPLEHLLHAGNSDGVCPAGIRWPDPSSSAFWQLERLRF
jgi:hypothetical protein